MIDNVIVLSITSNGVPNDAVHFQGEHEEINEKAKQEFVDAILANEYAKKQWTNLSDSDRDNVINDGQFELEDGSSINIMWLRNQNELKVHW